MGKTLINRDPLECFSELAGVSTSGASFVTFLGAPVSLTQGELLRREQALSRIFLEQAMIPWEVELSPAMERALDLEHFIVKLALRECVRKQQAPAPTSAPVRPRRYDHP